MDFRKHRTRSIQKIMNKIADEVINEVIKKYRGIKELDFKIRKDILEEAAKITIAKIGREYFSLRNKL